MSSLDGTANNNGPPLVIDASLPEEDSVVSSVHIFDQEQQASFADIIADAIAKADLKSAVASKNASSFSHPPHLCVTGITLTSGLEVLHVPRSGSQQESIGITSKHSRGDTLSACLKRKKTVTVALPNKNTADDILKHDLAADCQQWQV